MPIDDLRQVPALMADVILDQKPQRDRRIVSDHATRLQPFFGNAVHHGGKNLVLRLPPAQQDLPRLAGISVRGHPGLLRVLRAGIFAVNGAAHKPLAIVGGRVKQMPDNLFPRPSALAPGNVRECRRNG